MSVALVIIDVTRPTKIVPMQFIFPEQRHQSTTPSESDSRWALCEGLFDKLWRDLNPIPVDSPTACVQNLATLLLGQHDARLLKDTQRGPVYLGKIIFRKWVPWFHRHHPIWDA
jgi:hypothetical protein